MIAATIVATAVTSHLDVTVIYTVKIMKTVVPITFSSAQMVMIRFPSVEDSHNYNIHLKSKTS